MPTTLADFRLTATSEQLQVLDRLVELSDQETAAYNNYTKIQKEIDDGVARIRTKYGLQNMIVDADLELLVDPLLPERDSYIDQLNQVRTEMRDLFITAVADLDMSHLGFIQRHYQNVVGEPMPDIYNQVDFSKPK